MKSLNKIIIALAIFMLISGNVFAGITQQQGEDVAEFAKKFIEEGNSRRDENGFPLLTYCLTGNWKTNIQIRSGGYNGQMYYVKNNGYYIRNGKYLELGNKWCMDCGTTVLFLLKNTLGFELLNGQGEPWHVQDIYNDAARGSKSQYFDMIYSSVSVGRIDYSKLQKGDVIGYFTSHGNHGMLYLGDGYIAHANRDMIRSYGDNKISGFQVNKLNHYFLSGTRVSVMRIKDGVIPENRVVNGIVTWPDTGETVDLLGRTTIVTNVASIDEYVDPVYDENSIIPSYTLEELIDMMEKTRIAKENEEHIKFLAILSKKAQSQVLLRVNNRFIASHLDTAPKPVYYYSEYLKINNNSNKQFASL